jgi:CBS domain containing-hemolysin-like protein
MIVWPWLVAMAVLIACSAFFSASEAALFYLRWQDRRLLEAGSRAQRVAAGLLADPDRLLTAVLFWNLMTNMAYFAIASIVGIQLEDHPAAAVTFTFGSLICIIFLSETLPKSLAVLSPRRLATLVALPLAVAVRAVDPLMPVLRLVNLLSRRLIWPRFRAEPYLEVSDLERAIELSTSNAQHVEQEQTVLRNIVLLSEIRVDEWMRPRAQFRAFPPPVSLSDLGGKMTPSGYLLITEPDSEEVASAIHLQSLSDVPHEHLEHHAEPVLYIPWCSTVADALDQMQTRDRDAAAIVNEFGETIGILTFEDILDTIFSDQPSQSRRLFGRQPIRETANGVWRVTGMTGLRRLARYLDVELPPSRSVTVAGVIQETLQRLATVGDECDWGPFHLTVIEAPKRGQLLIELRRTAPHGSES